MFVLGGGVERVVLVVLVRRVGGKQERSRLCSVPAETEQQSIREVKGEQSGAEGSPEQAEEQKHALVAPSFVSVEVEKPELDVHHQEEDSIQSGVEDGEAKLDRGGDSRTKGNRGRQSGGVGRRGSCDWGFHQGT
ncbi:hypothetical protein INR49_028485, partial [Caranx melampygus]